MSYVTVNVIYYIIVMPGDRPVLCVITRWQSSDSYIQCQARDWICGELIITKKSFEKIMSPPLSLPSLNDAKIIKGCAIKTLTFEIYFVHISGSKHRIFNILVPTQHNIPLIMWGTDKNCKDQMKKS